MESDTIGILAIDEEDGIEWALNVGIREYVIFTDDNKDEMYESGLKEIAVTRRYFLKLVNDLRDLLMY